MIYCSGNIGTVIASDGYRSEKMTITMMNSIPALHCEVKLPTSEFSVHIYNIISVNPLKWFECSDVRYGLHILTSSTEKTDCSVQNI